MLYDEIHARSPQSAKFMTIFFEIFTEEQLLEFLLKLQDFNKEEGQCIIGRHIQPGWVVYDLEAIDPDPTLWDYEELCMIYLFKKFDILLTTNPKEGIAKFS